MTNKENSQFLANTIKKARKKLGQNQTQFGELFSPPAAKGIVSRWEKGKSIPSEERLAKISSITGLSINELLYGSLNKAITNIIDFSLSYDNERLKIDMKSDLPVEEATYLKNANTLRFYAISDFSFITPPKEIKNIKYGNYNNEQEKILDEYVNKQEEIKFKYYLNETIKRARATNCSPNDKYILMDILISVAKHHFNNEPYTNKGLIKMVERKIDSIATDDMFELIYSYNYNNEETIRTAKKISPEVEEEIYSIIEDAENKLHDLYDGLDSE